MTENTDHDADDHVCGPECEQIGKLVMNLIRMKAKTKQHADMAQILTQRACEAKVKGDKAVYQKNRDQAVEEYTALVDTMIDLGAEIVTSKPDDVSMEVFEVDLDDDAKPSGRVFN
jgi:hypothetical protein